MPGMLSWRDGLVQVNVLIIDPIAVNPEHAAPHPVLQRVVARLCGPFACLLPSSQRLFVAQLHVAMLPP